MPLIYQFDQAAAINMGINLSCRDIRMAEHRLQSAQVCTARQQMRGKRVAQYMRADLSRVDARYCRQFADNLKQANAADMDVAFARRACRARGNR